VIKSCAEKFFAPYHNTVNVTEEDSNHIVFGVSGIKNSVLKGQDLWEKIQFYVSSENSDVEKGNKYFFIVSDGFYTAGIGKEPADLQLY
jgi:hypothetical protein